MVVGEDDTGRGWRSGSVDVLATPRVIALCEEASVRAIAPEVPPGSTTVGMKVRIDHLQPSPIGATVVAEATVKKVEGRRITLTVSASDERGLIAVGRVVRALVDVEIFLAKCGA